MKHLNKMTIYTRIILTISLILNLQAETFAQDSINNSLRSESIARLLPNDYHFVPGQLNNVRNSACNLELGSSNDYHIRSGYVGFDITADPLDEWASSPNWITSLSPSGCSVGYPCVIRSYPYTWGSMGVDIDGDASEEPVQLLTSFGCGGELGYYRYQTKFCLSPDATGANLDIKVLADNNARVYLNGILLGGQAIELIHGFYEVNLLELSSTSLLIGENILEIEVANFSYITEGPTQGVNFEGLPSFTACAVYANITTETGCVKRCDQKGLITGHKFNDLNNNGTLEDWETPIEGITINLIESGVVVATTTTDEEGFFYFFADPGTYDIAEVSDMTNTYPGDGIHESQTLAAYEFINNILFLNTDYQIEPCEGCDSKFNPIPGERYWMSAWVHVDYLEQMKTFYNEDGGFIRIIYLGVADAPAVFYPTGEIIDGWQRIVGEFLIPPSVEDLAIDLMANPEFDTYFDDIRIHPFNASMKSYVYDGETFWLVSELDDNNYATFYEYDSEGGLIRIKKETSRGIVTIQETISNTIKQNN